MAGEKQRQALVNALFGGDESPKGKGHEQPPQLPPYLVRKGTHRIDARIQRENAEDEAIAKSALVALDKFGFGGVVGETSAYDGPTTNALPSADDVHTLFTMAGALFPPYDPEVLSSLVEHSNSLRPNIDAYKTNIHGFGYRLDAVIDTKDPEASKKVGDALFLDRLYEQELKGEGTVAPYPSDEEIDARTKEIESLARFERAQIEQFFEHCAGEISFKELRRRTCEDLEATGNAYWEVVRNGADKIAEFHLVPSYSMRLAPIEHVLHRVKNKRKVTPFRFNSVEVRRRFRRYIQVVLDRIVYFKEFGDPRVISKRTGRVYPNVEELVRDAVHDGPATEIIHFKVYSPRSPYGVPRWIGNLLSVLGSRASEEVNYLYFDNKAVPPLALLVSGGKLAQGASEKIESYIADNIRGKENFHKILVVEAEPAGGGPGGNIQVETGRVRIELVPLRDAQQEDALFQNYDQANQDKVGQAFRVPRLLRGDTKDFNRATADAALQFAETQVFQGEREIFDDLINRMVFSELLVRFWIFRSNSPVNRDPIDASKILQILCQTGSLTPNEARELASDILNKPLAPIDAAWANQPMVMTLAGVVADAAGNPSLPAAAPAKSAEDGEDGPMDSTETRPPELAPAGLDHQRTITTLAGRIMALRDSLKKAGDAEYRRVLKKAHEAESVITLEVPSATFRSWVTVDAPAAE